MKFVYSEKSIVFYKSVAPASFFPLWDIDMEVFSFDAIPARILNLLSENDIDSILWFFEDMDTTNKRSIKC